MNKIYSAGKIKLDPKWQRITVGNKMVHLTNQEYKILEYLIKHQDEDVSRRKLLDEIWVVNNDMMSNVIDAHVKNLRKKIKLKSNPKIETVRGVGYKLKV